MTLGAAYLGLFAAGLAGSLHCIGMCGPILAAFSQAFRGDRDEGNNKSLALDFTLYHIGRLWTYSMLGLAAGLAGSRLGPLFESWQRPLSVLLACTVIATGLLLSGAIPRPRIASLLGSCGFVRLRGNPWFRAVVASPSRSGRLLTGVAMGLLPCGLVYAMLLLVMSLGHPLAAAAGMLAFGLGTLPALSAVLAATRAVPARWRVQGSRIVAVGIIAAGSWMLARSLLVSPTPDGCALCASATADQSSH